MDTKASLGFLIAAVVVIILAGSVGFVIASYPSGGTISGIGNSANVIKTDAAGERLAALMIARENPPVVTDEQLAKIYQAITEKAAAGDVRAAVVLFEIAAKQDAKKKPGAKEKQRV